MLHITSSQYNNYDRNSITRASFFELKHLKGLLQFIKWIRSKTELCRTPMMQFALLDCLTQHVRDCWNEANRTKLPPNLTGRSNESPLRALLIDGPHGFCLWDVVLWSCGVSLQVLIESWSGSDKDLFMANEQARRIYENDELPEDWFVF